MNDEWSLIKRAQQGDNEAFEQLFEASKDRIFNYLLGQLGSRADAEDATLEIFAKAWKGLESFRGVCKFHTWVFSIAVKHYRTILRDRRRHVQTTSLSSLQPERVMLKEAEAFIERLIGEAPDANPETILLNTEKEKKQIEVISRAVDQLSEKFKDVFILRYIKGRTETEVADLLGLKIGTVRSRQSKAQKRVKRLIEFYMKNHIL